MHRGPGATPSYSALLHKPNILYSSYVNFSRDKLKKCILVERLSCDDTKALGNAYPTNIGTLPNVVLVTLDDDHLGYDIVCWWDRLVVNVDAQARYQLAFSIYLDHVTVALDVVDEAAIASNRDETVFEIFSEFICG